MIDHTNHQPQDQFQKGSESFGNVRNDSESFGKLPNASESFGSVPKHRERKTNHVLTVREVSRMFEESGVARTERSIVNWCQSSKTGIARLDAYFDPNERRYYITPESVGHAIEEEKAKVVKNGQVMGDADIAKASESRGNESESDKKGDIQKLQAELTDLKITNRAKDYVIRQYEEERKDHVKQMMSLSHQVGELETKLLQLKAPDQPHHKIESGEKQTEEHFGMSEAA